MAGSSGSRAATLAHGVPRGLHFTVKWPRSLAPQAPALSPQRLQSPEPVCGLGARHARSSELEGLTVVWPHSPSAACLHSRTAKPTDGLAERTRSDPEPKSGRSHSRPRPQRQAGLPQGCRLLRPPCFLILLRHLFVKGGPTSRGEPQMQGSEWPAGARLRLTVDGWAGYTLHNLRALSTTRV